MDTAERGVILLFIGGTLPSTKKIVFSFSITCELTVVCRYPNTNSDCISKMSLPDLAVVIPFFQRERGLLRRALYSIFAQRLDKPIEVIVIDDGSPVSAADELKGLTPEHAALVRVIRQANGGVAAARNAGLTTLAPTTEYVAFLDPDDVWGRSHLQKMRTAFEAGAELYFADFVREGETRSRFQWSGVAASECTPLDDTRSLSWFHGDLVLALCAGRSPLSLSAVAYRRAAAPDLAFSGVFHRCSEDNLFIAELVSRPLRIALSRSCDVKFGIGVGLYSSATYGTHAALERLCDASRFHTILKGWRLSADQKQYNRRSLASVDREFVEATLAYIKHRKRIPTKICGEYARLRSAFLMQSPALVTAILWRRLTERLLAGKQRSGKLG